MRGVICRIRAREVTHTHIHTGDKGVPWQYKRVMREGQYVGSEPGGSLTHQTMPLSTPT